MRNRGLRGVAALLLVLGTARLEAADPDEYPRDVKPILASNCYACHGAKVQMMGLRLDATTISSTHLSARVLPAVCLPQQCRRARAGTGIGRGDRQAQLHSGAAPKAGRRARRSPERMAEEVLIGAMRRPGRRCAVIEAAISHREVPRMPTPDRQILRVMRTAGFAAGIGDSGDFSSCNSRREAG
jgi:hypothetical protein